MKRLKRQKIVASKTHAAAKRRVTEPPEVTTKPWRPFVKSSVCAICMLLVVTYCLWSPLFRSQATVRNADHKLRVTLTKDASLPTFADLTMMSEEELNKLDIALLNLRVTEGLPGAESLKVTDVLTQLDRWAKKVKTETDRNFVQFMQNPDEFNNSEPYFLMLMLVTVLQQDFGVHYNLQRVNDIDFTNSRDLFIHGMVGSSNGGTCVSMPVLYTAVARRLGYPVFLVNAKEHLFCRWDGQGKRVNVEGTNRGMNSFDDEHYMSWPHPIGQHEVDDGLYLKSLSNAESFSAFLAIRGHCLEDSGSPSEAATCYSLAVKHYPHPMYRGFLSRLVRPKTIDDFPELLGQQQRLFQQREKRFSQLKSNSPHHSARVNLGNSVGLTNQTSAPSISVNSSNNYSALFNESSKR